MTSSIGMSSQVKNIEYAIQQTEQTNHTTHLNHLFSRVSLVLIVNNKSGTSKKICEITANHIDIWIAILAHSGVVLLLTNSK